MIVVHEIFIAKPGYASKLAALFKEMAAVDPTMKGVRILTDVTGQYNRVIMQSEFASLADYEKGMEEYRKAGPPSGKMASYLDMYQTGSREIYRVM